jgi:hypothetical protein
MLYRLSWGLKLGLASCNLQGGGSAGQRWAKLTICLPCAQGETDASPPPWLQALLEHMQLLERQVADAMAQASFADTKVRIDMTLATC